jgi:amidohydrolase
MDETAKEVEEDGFILVSRDEENLVNVPQSISCAGYKKNEIQDNWHDPLSDIDRSIKSLSISLWPLNEFIHENPELAFEEHKAHDALTGFMRLHKGWKVTPSAYGMKTAWLAIYDSGKAGPVVSFNVEMGRPCSH